MRAPVTIAILLYGTASWARSPDRPVPIEAPSPLSAGTSWEPVGPRNAGGFSDVALVPVDGSSSIIFAVTLDGALYRSDDGDRWQRLLRPLASDDALNQSDLQYALDDRLADELSDQPEAVGDYETPGGGDDADYVVDEGLPANDLDVREAIEIARAEDADARSLASKADPRVWATADGLVFVGRADGLWVSADSGSRFERALDLPVTAILHVGDEWFAGTTDGVRFTSDPTIWRGAGIALEGSSVLDLSVDDGGMHAAALDGLWHSADGRRWLGEGVVDEAVTAIGWLFDTNILMIGTASTTLAAPLYGRSLAQAPARSPGGVVQILPIAPHHVLTVGADGPWESLDDGATWRPATKGMLHRRALGVAALDHDIWLAAPDGLYRLVQEDLSATAPLDPQRVSVDVLVGAATSRPGVANIPVGNRVWAALMPNLVAEGRLVTGSSIVYNGIPDDPADPTNASEPGLDWYATARLVWTPPKSRRGGDFEPFVLGDGTAEDAAFAEGQQQAARTADRLGTEYALKVTADVVDLYHAWVGLLSERDTIATRPLRDQVNHELRIREVEAKLDALTDGALTRARTVSSED